MKFSYVSLLLPLVMACETPTEPGGPRIPIQPDANGPVVITGRIMIADGAMGIQSANVRVLEASASVVTDEAGRYRIVLPASFRERTIPVQVRAIGFSSQSRTVSLSRDRVSVDFAMAVLRMSCMMDVRELRTAGERR